MVLIRRREWAFLAMLVAGAIVYVGARLFAEIHVEAKALAVIAPLVLLVALRGLLGPGEREPRDARPLCVRRSRAASAATASTLLALRAAPVGYDDRQAASRRSPSAIDGESVAFLGVDRFAGYYLRGTLARAPAGYVPEEIAARPEKVWQQGQAADFDTLDSGKLDKFRYAITTAAAYASTPPPNFEPVPRRATTCSGAAGRDAAQPRAAGRGRRARARRSTATELPRRAARHGDRARPASRWRRIRAGTLPPPVDDAAGGQERAFAAPGEATAMVAAAARRAATSSRFSTTRRCRSRSWSTTR